MTRAASTLEAGLPLEWPALPLEAWRDTYATVHMWTQVVGKICLALTPLTNHFWNIAFQVTARGLATPPLTAGRVTFTMTFDFVDHQLIAEAADGRGERLPLEPRTVADFYAAVIELLRRLDVRVRIWTTPVEIPDPIPFERDTVHRSYDPEAANRFWRVLVAIKPVFDLFRADFVGKCSPVHFFWGSFDLAVTRFSGEPAPARPDADRITREAYSHAVISHGFWPGSGAVEWPAFYAYAAPEPDGFRQASVLPDAAYYDTALSEYILPYEAVRTAASPDADLTAFLRTTYDAAATLAHWDRSRLERR
jgi:hypothetical protein